MSDSTSAQPALVELRRYRLRPDHHEALSTVFGRHLVVPQEAAGMQVLGWFADAAEPDHFVWLRGFPTHDADARAASLARFYGGPACAAHREAANATMLDSDDVLLLAPAGAGCGIAAQPDPQGGALRVITCLLRRTPLPERRLEDVLSILRPPGARRAVLVSAGVPNRFPGLPVREDPALVWIEAADDLGTRQRLDAVAAALDGELDGQPEIATLWPADASPTPALPVA